MSISYVNQMLHYSNKFNNFVVCHHKLSFYITNTLFLFKTPPPPQKKKQDVLQMCHTTFYTDLDVLQNRISWPEQEEKDNNNNNKTIRRTDSLSMMKPYKWRVITLY